MNKKLILYFSVVGVVIIGLLAIILPPLLKQDPQKVELDLPDATISELPDSKLEAYSKVKLEPKKSAYDDYYQSLLEETPDLSDSSSSLTVAPVVPKPKPRPAPKPKPQPTVRPSSSPTNLSVEEQARQQAEWAASQHSAEVGPKPSPTEEKIIISSAPAQVGVISSLSSTSTSSGGFNTVAPSQVKAKQVVKVETITQQKISTGNQVVLKLLERLDLGDGTILQEGTLLTSTASISQNRLLLQVVSINYKGRLISTNLMAFDKDGQQGLYSPSTIKSSVSKETARDIAMTATQTIGSVFGSVGSLAGSTINKAMGQSTSQVNVTLMQGYEFYLSLIPTK